MQEEFELSVIEAVSTMAEPVFDTSNAAPSFNNETSSETMIVNSIKSTTLEHELNQQPDHCSSQYSEVKASSCTESDQPAEAEASSESMIVDSMSSLTQASTQVHAFPAQMDEDYLDLSDSEDISVRGFGRAAWKFSGFEKCQRQSCFKAGSKIIACKLCKTAKYCSLKCQRIHWNYDHKHNCTSGKRYLSRVGSLRGSLNEMPPDFKYMEI